MTTEFEVVAERIIRIDQIVRQLDESIRPLAFQMLARAAEQIEVASALPGQHPLPLAGLEEFAARHASETPAQNMLTLTAWIYLQEGDSPITPQKIRSLADACGLRVPRRPDCTLRYASHRSNLLFSRHGYGWLLTPYGQAYVRQQFGASERVAHTTPALA